MFFAPLRYRYYTLILRVAVMMMLMLRARHVEKDARAYDATYEHTPFDAVAAMPLRWLPCRYAMFTPPCLSVDT